MYCDINIPMLMWLNTPHQDRKCMFNNPILFINALNLAPPNGFVNKSASWHCEIICNIFTSADDLETVCCFFDFHDSNEL